MSTVALEKASGIHKFVNVIRWKTLFTSKVDSNVQWDRWDFIAMAVALLILIWVFALKLKTFYNLGYSSDLFVSVQLARGWLRGSGLTPRQLLWKHTC